jgi:lipid II isoglutaminyl synthase (glutamine-hydrolysing)
MLQKALYNKYQTEINLTKVNDSLVSSARDVMFKRLDLSSSLKTA